MRLALLCVLAASGCFDFGRVERVGDLGASDLAFVPPSPDASTNASDGGLAVTCPNIGTGVYGPIVSGGMGEYVSVVAKTDEPDDAYGATETGELLHLMTQTATPILNVSTLPGGPYTTIARIAEDPTTAGSIVIGANGSSTFEPVVRGTDGQLVATSPVQGTAFDIAATKQYTVAAIGSMGSYSVVPSSRMTSSVRAAKLVNSTTRPRLLALGDVVVVCGSDGLDQLDPADGMITMFSPTDPAHRTCSYVTAVSLSTGATRLAYVSNDGFVCVHDDVNAPWRCTQPLDAPVMAVAIAPCDPNFLIAITPGNVYMSSDDGASWSQMSKNLPTTTLLDVTITNNGVGYFIASGGNHFTWTQ